MAICDLRIKDRRIGKVLPSKYQRKKQVPWLDFNLNLPFVPEVIWVSMVMEVFVRGKDIKYVISGHKIFTKCFPYLLISLSELGMK